MGNVESCCAYGASPRPDRTPKLKPGGAYRGSNNRSNGSNYAHQQVRIETQLIKLRNEYDGVSPDPGGTNRGFPGTSGPPRSEESCGNLQHISEREPDDWEQDPSLHPTRETLFMEKTKKSIQNGLVRKRSQMHLASSRSSGELRVIKKSSSCSTIYIDDSTVSQPNLKNTIKVVSLAIYYNIKNRTSNQVLDIFDEKTHPLTKERDGVQSDYNRYNPEHRQIYKFIRTLFNAAQLTAECAIVTLVYIERLIKYAEVDISPGSWKRITLMSILLASKVWDDQAVWNVDYCQILKDLTVEDVNELEREFLRLLQFNTNVPQSVFVKYYFELRTLAEANDLAYPPEPLSRERASKLEAMSMSYDDKVTQEVIQASIRKWASVDKLFVNRRNPLILS